LKKHWSAPHLRWLKYVGIATVACFALVSTSIVSEYRSTGLKDVEWSKVDPFTTDRIEADTNILGSTVDAFEFFPERHDYLFGSTFAVLPVTFVPRAWWPSKPESLGIIMVELRNPNEVTYSEAVSTIGELYVNFGVLGIPLGMLVYGFACQLLYLLYCRNRSNLYFLTFYVLSLPFFTMHVRGEFVTVWAHYFSLAVPLYVGMRLCRKRVSHHYATRALQMASLPR
jgi:oligosaccharide repeat unit polymerase